MNLRAITILLSIALFAFSSPEESGVQFYNGSYDNLLREARKEKKPIILDFWASWCAPCKKMDQETFKDEQLALFLKANFLIYKVDVDSFNGKLISEKYNIESFPSTLVLDSKGNKIDVLKGFYPAQYLKKELVQITVDHGITIP